MSESTDVGLVNFLTLGPNDLAEAGQELQEAVARGAFLLQAGLHADAVETYGAGATEGKIHAALEQTRTWADKDAGIAEYFLVVVDDRVAGLGVISTNAALWVPTAYDTPDDMWEIEIDRDTELKRRERAAIYIGGWVVPPSIDTYRMTGEAMWTQLRERALQLRDPGKGYVWTTIGIEAAAVEHELMIWAEMYPIQTRPFVPGLPHKRVKPNRGTTRIISPSILYAHEPGAE